MTISIMAIQIYQFNVAPPIRYKVGSVFSMVISSEFRIKFLYRDNDYRKRRKDASHFIKYEISTKHRMISI